MARKKKTQLGKSTAGQRARGKISGRDFNPDYTYVIQDLRRIGLLTGMFLTILIVLSFILN